jgi:hypothetical protein
MAKRELARLGAASDDEDTAFIQHGEAVLLTGPQPVGMGATGPGHCHCGTVKICT